MREGNKTSKKQLGYAEKYLAKFESCMVRLAPGTRKRIADLGYSSVNAFIVKAVMERLEKEESYQ